ncbi:MAG: BON domain-containing protein [Steroidobacteraceae bacterium]|jgi:osmotically-inducible protein OsmY
MIKERILGLQHGMLATLFVLGATCACTYPQNSQRSQAPPLAYVASDAELAARVKAALHTDPNVNDTHIEVFIENGSVVLRGLVEDNRALIDALQIARKAAKGRNVIDDMSIMKNSAH